MNDNFSKANEIAKEYSVILSKLVEEVEKGSTLSSVIFLQRMTERNKKLKSLGYRVADSDDDTTDLIVKIN